MKLFTVGPVMMDKDILEVSGSQLPYFRTPEFSEVMFKTTASLKRLANLKEEDHAIIITGSGTSAMEAVCAGSFDENDRLLIINGGSFGQRFVQICSIYHIPYDEIKLEYPEQLTNKHFENIDGSKYTALLVNVHETSTGQLYDMDLISTFTKKYNLKLIVDAISSFLADDFDMQKYCIDCAIVSSQKALALSPGLGMVLMTKDFYETNVVNKPAKNLYLNLVEHVRNMERGQTPNTPAVGIILELQKRLEQIEAQGKEEVKRQIMSLAQYFRNEAVKHGLEIPQSFTLSNALTPIYFKNGNAKEVYHFLRDNYDLTVTPCGGALENYILRVGHIGALNKEDYDELFLRIDEYNRQHQPKMKMFLMAAGMGTRISQITNQPKSTLEITEGLSLIEHTVNLLLENKIEVNIITGYKGEAIKEKLKGYPVNYYENPFYRDTNSIASLWFCKERLTPDTDILLANADVFWEQDILNQLLSSKHQVTLLMDESRVEIGDYFFHSKNGHLIEYGKDLPVERRTGEYVGIAKVKANFVMKMVAQLNKLIHEGNYNLWWENTLYSMIGKEDIMTEDISGKFWSEIDVYEDYLKIVDYMNQKNNKF